MTAPSTHPTLSSSLDGCVYILSAFWFMMVSIISVAAFHVT